MTPAFGVDHFDDESFINKKLLQFSLGKQNKIRQRKQLQRAALLVNKILFFRLNLASFNAFLKQAKVRECRKPLPVDIYDEVLPKPQQFYVQQLREFVEKTPIPPMMKKIESKILSFVTNKKLMTKHSPIVESYMHEVHNEFNKMMKAYSVNRIIKPGPNDFVPPRCDFTFKRLGRTERYDTFLTNRTNIKRNLLLHLPFNRAILDYSYRYFPRYLINLALFRDKEINLSDLKATCKSQIVEAAITIRNDWYPKIIGIIIKHYKKKIIPAKMWKKALSCAGKLINRQLNEMKMRTINHMLFILGDKRKIPILFITTECETELIFNPDKRSMYKTYEDLIDDILRFGEHLDPITKYFDIETEKQFKNPAWKIEIGPIYAEEVKKQLWDIISSVYDEVSGYMEEMQYKFQKLSSSTTQDELLTFLSEPRGFEECLSQINELEVLLDQVQRLLAREFFDIATIDQAGAQVGLKATGRTLIEKVVDKLLESHFNENLDICNEFEVIRENALRHPKSTEELLENGEYIMWAKNTYIHDLKDRIQRSLQVSSSDYASTSS